MKKLLLIALCALICGLPMQAQNETATVTVDPEYQAELGEMLRLANTLSVLDDATEHMKQTFANVPVPPEQKEKADEVFAVLMGIFDGIKTDIFPLLAPIYQKYISLDDLKATNAFYRTSAGQRLAEAMPKMSSDIMTATVQLMKDSVIVETAVDAEYVEEFTKMVHATGAFNSLDQMVPHLRQNMATYTPDDEKLDNATASLEATLNYLRDNLIPMLVPIYEKYVALDDLKAINAFYQTPAGLRLTEKTPEMLQETMEVTMKYTMEKMQALMAKLQEQGLIPNKAE